MKTRPGKIFVGKFSFLNGTISNCHNSPAEILGENLPAAMFKNNLNIFSKQIIIFPLK